MASLVGQQLKDTYDSLIKVTDNGPLSGSLKTLTDGLGNNSALALSTTAASITGSLTTTAKTRAERVQVGTAATLNDATGVGNTLQFANYTPSVFVTGSADSYIYKNSSVFGNLAAQSLVFQTRSDTTGGGFAFVAGGTPAVVATITSAGNVGIGTTSPAVELDVDGEIRASDGILFGTDTATANALDDYEEGNTNATFTATTSGTITANTSLDRIEYTKIGDICHVQGTVYVSSVSSPVGDVRINCLPFLSQSISETADFLSANVVFYDGTTYSQEVATIVPNVQYINVFMDASTLATSDRFFIQATYKAV